MVSKRYLPVFVLLVSCFALWGLLNNMTDNLVPAFQRIFGTSQSTAGVVQISFYGAYSVVALAASFLIQRAGYRVGVLAGLGVYCIGALLYVPACILESFWTYIAGIFIVAGGCAVLETTCNPYVLTLGDEATAVRRRKSRSICSTAGRIRPSIPRSTANASSLPSKTRAVTYALKSATFTDIIRMALSTVTFLAL